MIAGRRRGLTLIELTLALGITAIVASAIAAMIAAVSFGESTRRDNRSYLIRAHAAKSRLAAYLAPGRAILHTDGVNLVAWLNDQRESGTVHASEIRWIRFDETTGDLNVYFVAFPDEMTAIAKALEDDEYDPGADWVAVLDAYGGDGLVGELPLLDGLAGVTVTLDDPDPLASDAVTFAFDFLTRVPGQVARQTVTVSLLEHEPPAGP